MPSLKNGTPRLNKAFTPKRIKNYNFHVRERNREMEELPWTRVGDFLEMDLPRPIVLINGCFDLLHSGHMKVIFAARDRAETLICAMDSDRRVSANKGAGRPIMSWIERAVALNFMPIDYLVEIDTDREFKSLVSIVKPDLRVQGGDHETTISRVSTPKMFVRNWGMRTSTLVRRCQEVNLDRNK
jgi:cytidyltransferase-like protein